MSNLIDSARQGTFSVASATQLTIDRSHDEARLVLDKAGRAKVHPLAPLCDHDDSGMVGHPARWGRRSPLVEADAGNLCCPILFLTHEGGNLLREFCLRPVGLARFQRGLFFCVFHVNDLYRPF